METLIIKYPSDSKAVLMRALEELSSLGVKFELSPAKKEVLIPGLPYTHGERVEAVLRSQDEIAAGRFVTTTQLRAKHPEIWK